MSCVGVGTKHFHLSSGRLEADGGRVSKMRELNDEPTGAGSLVCFMGAAHQQRIERVAMR